MRPAYSERVERGRIVGDPRMPSFRGDQFGWFRLLTNDRQALTIIASPWSEEIPWEHVSVSLRRRCPLWAEMAWVKGLFWGEEEVVIQFHPRLSVYVNHHPYCLHLWRPLGVTLPEPPPMAVGPTLERLGD